MDLRSSLFTAGYQHHVTASGYVRIFRLKAKTHIAVYFVVFIVVYRHVVWSVLAVPDAPCPFRGHHNGAFIVTMRWQVINCFTSSYSSFRAAVFFWLSITVTNIIWICGIQTLVELSIITWCDAIELDSIHLSHDVLIWLDIGLALNVWQDVNARGGGN